MDALKLRKLFNHLPSAEVNELCWLPSLKEVKEVDCSRNVNRRFTVSVQLATLGDFTCCLFYNYIGTEWDDPGHILFLLIGISIFMHLPGSVRP